MFVGSAVNSNPVSAVLLRPELFVLTVCIVGNDLVGGIKNGGCRPVILFQLNHHGIRIILFKIKDIPDIGAAPPINTLVIITDNTEVPAFRCQDTDQLVLDVVGILVFIHHDIPEPFPVCIKDRGMAGEKLQGLHQQIVKIQRVQAFHPGFICNHDIVDSVAPEITAGLGEPLIRREEPVFGIADFVGGFTQRDEAVIHVQLFIDLFQHTKLVILIIDYKRAGISELFDIPPENSCADGMKSADPGFVCPLGSDQRFNPVLHLPGGFVGECQCENGPCRDSVINQVGQAVGQCACFSASGTGQDQQRTFKCFGGFPLFAVKYRDIHYLLFSISSRTRLYPSAP